MELGFLNGQMAGNIVVHGKMEDSMDEEIITLHLGKKDKVNGCRGKE